MPEESQTESNPTEPASEEAIRRVIAKLGATNELEVSVATKQKPSDVRRALDALERQQLIRRGGRHSRHFGDTIELTQRGRRSL